MLLVLTYVEKKNMCVILIVFFLMGVSKLFPRANNMEKFSQISLHIYNILSINSSFHLLFPLSSRSLNLQTNSLVLC